MVINKQRRIKEYNKTHKIKKGLGLSVSMRGAAVGADIDRYLLGQEDWTKLVDSITRAFVYMIQDLIFTEIQNASSKLPVTTGFVESGAISKANKKKIDKVLQNVSVANDNAPVVIMGTYVALQEFDNLIDINFNGDLPMKT